MSPRISRLVLAALALLALLAPAARARPARRSALATAIDKGDLPALTRLLKKAKKKELETRELVPDLPGGLLTPLELAARRGNPAAVEALLGVGAQPTAGALEAAAAAGHLELVKRLLGLGAARPDIALRTAIKADHADVVAVLLPLAAADRMYDSLLSLELALEHPDVMAVLLAARPDLSRTTLVLASALRKRLSASARALIEAGAPVEAEDSTGSTPLMLAAETAQLDLFELLLAHKADPRRIGSKGTTVLSALVKSDPTQGAAVLDFIVGKLKLPVDLPGGNGATALMQAAATGNAAWTTLLLARKASPAIASKSGLRAIDFALTCTMTPGTWSGPTVGSCAGDVALLLLAAKSPLPAPDKRGRSFLARAFMSGNEALALKALTLSKDDDLADDDGNTPLHFAARFATPAAVQALLARKNSDPSAINKYKETPLHIANSAGRGEVAALLQAAGATE